MMDLYMIGSLEKIDLMVYYSDSLNTRLHNISYVFVLSPE